MKLQFGSWLLGQPRSEGTLQVVCPPELMPTVYQNPATGGMGLRWPEVCYCPANGPAVHEEKAGCLSTVADIDPWVCNCPGEAHLPTCPFDVCPCGTCHPMCSQAVGDANELYCNCACHG